MYQHRCADSNRLQHCRYHSRPSHCLLRRRMKSRHRPSAIRCLQHRYRQYQHQCIRRQTHRHTTRPTSRARRLSRPHQPMSHWQAIQHRFRQMHHHQMSRPIQSRSRLSHHCRSKAQPTRHCSSRPHRRIRTRCLLRLRRCPHSRSRRRQHMKHSSQMTQTDDRQRRRHLHRRSCSHRRQHQQPRHQCRVTQSRCSRPMPHRLRQTQRRIRRHRPSPQTRRRSCCCRHRSSQTLIRP